MKRYLILLVFAASFLFVSNVSAAQDPNFYVFLCFGQSNMEGFPGTIQEQDKTVDSRFQMLAAVDFPDMNREKGKWYTAVPPLCRPGCGLCPADYFGRTLVANLPENIKVGVINVAVAGCKIECFEKDTYQEYVSTSAGWLQNIVKQYDGNPYQYLVDLGKKAQAEGGVIKGILLHQGESNSGDKQWPTKVAGIYNNMIKDLNLKPEEAPLIVGQLVGGSMSQIMDELPKQVPTAHIISSAGCGNIGVHFNSQGYRLLGTRCGEEMLKLLGYEVKKTEEPAAASN